MVEINNLTKSRIERNLIKRVIELVLEGEQKEGLEVSVAIVGEQRMKRLNSKWRGRNEPTDILSFEDPPELVICPSQLKKTAKKYKWGEKESWVKILIHGTLHILGYDHHTPKDYQQMKTKEEYYFNFLNERSK